MHKKPLVSAIITVLLMSILFGYSLVFGEAGSYNGPVRLEYISGKNIYPVDLELNKTKLLFRSGVDLTDIKIISSCDTYSKMLYKKKDLYYFDLKYFSDCTDSSIFLINKQGQTIYTWELEIAWEFQLYNKFIDHSSKEIENIQSFLSQKILQSSNEKLSSNVLTREKQKRALLETQYIQWFLQNLLILRNEKYLVPVSGYNISHEAHKIPNANRPYRATYTDGIHHGWDVGSKFWESVRAIDEWIIVRVISDFEYSDLSNINYWDNLSDQDKIKNLDILRWNQVWLKTSRGDVVFYSHLEDVTDHLKEWVVVRKGETLWTIGITWVPDKDYTDYHLHFTIHKNPYNKSKGKIYTLDDYMKWDWYFKWQPLNEVLKYQKEVFQSEY